MAVKVKAAFAALWASTPFPITCAMKVCMYLSVPSWYPSSLTSRFVPGIPRPCRCRSAWRMISRSLRCTARFHRPGPGPLMGPTRRPSPAPPRGARHEPPNQLARMRRTPTAAWTPPWSQSLLPCGCRGPALWCVHEGVGGCAMLPTQVDLGTADSLHASRGVVMGAGCRCRDGLPPFCQIQDPFHPGCSLAVADSSSIKTRARIHSFWFPPVGTLTAPSAVA